MYKDSSKSLVKVNLAIARFYVHSLMSFSRTLKLCDAIKQNESEVCKINFHFSHWLYTLSAKLSKQHIPLQLVNWFLRYRQLKGWKTIGNKEIICFSWLYLKISIWEFQLILLDRIIWWKIGLVHFRFNKVKHKGAT